MNLKEAIERERRKQEAERKAAEEAHRRELLAVAEREQRMAELFAQHVMESEGIVTDAADWKASELQNNCGYNIHLVRPGSGHVEANGYWQLNDADHGIRLIKTVANDHGPWRSSRGGTYCNTRTLAQACLYAGIEE